MRHVPAERHDPRVPDERRHSSSPPRRPAATLTAMAQNRLPGSITFSIQPAARHHRLYAHGRPGRHRGGDRRRRLRPEPFRQPGQVQRRSRGHRERQRDAAQRDRPAARHHRPDHRHQLPRHHREPTPFTVQEREAFDITLAQSDPGAAGRQWWHAHPAHEYGPQPVPYGATLALPACPRALPPPSTGRSPR